MVTGSMHTGFQVADLDRSVAFYRDLLGFELVATRTVTDAYIGRIVGYPGVEIRQAFLRIPGSDHGLELLDYRGVEREAVDTRTANPGTAHICLTVSDLRDLHRRLSDAGVVFVSDPVEVPFGPNAGALALYLADPDGIRVELVQPVA
jgi:catechol 2,3-dioxygenase-like lactoylglutathione lyase family enzyme